MQSQVPGNVVGQWGVTVNTSLLNFVSGSTGGGLFGYTDTPDTGNLYFAISPAGGTDPYGNVFSPGINVVSGSLQGVSIIGASMDSTSTLNGTNLQTPNVLNPYMSGGTASSLTHTMNNANGGVLGYKTSASSAVTYSTTGVYFFTVPTGITTLRVQCWGAGAGAGGGNAQQGGEGGGGGEYSEEPAYAVAAGQVYQIFVGDGGTGGFTGHVGSDGGDTTFGVTATGPGVLNGLAVIANGGSAGGGFAGGNGGTGSINTIHFDGGNGASGSGNTGGNGGGGSGGPSGQGNAGQQSLSSTGAAGGAAVPSGGAGGSGGNNGVAGSAGGSPGGAGGGAGAASGQVLSKVYQSQGTWCYFGQDASGAKPNGLANHNGAMYQGQNNGFTTYGHLYSFFLLPYVQIQSDLSGAVVRSVAVRLHNLHSYYPSGMYVDLRYTAQHAFGSTADAGFSSTRVATYHIKQGQSLSYNVGTASSIGLALQNGSCKSMELGPVNTPGNNYFGYFDPGSSGSPPEITVFYYFGSSVPVQAGNGSDGQVIVTYASSAAPTFTLSVSATQTIDPYGNTVPTGFTGPQVNLTAQSSAPTALASTAILTASTAATPMAVMPSGLSGMIAPTNTDTSTNTLGNSTVPTAISTGWVIAGGDMNVGTLYEMGVPFTGVHEGQVLNFGVLINGVNRNICPVGGAFATTGDNTAGFVRIYIMCITTGITGTIQVWTDGCIQDSTINRGLTPGLGVLAGIAQNVSINTTAPNTIATSAFYTATATGQTTVGHGSVFKRIGP